MQGCPVVDATAEISFMQHQSHYCRFNSRYAEVKMINEEDHFQKWLTNSLFDVETKSEIVQRAHLKSYGQPISISKAFNFIKMGTFLN